VLNIYSPLHPGGCRGEYILSTDKLFLLKICTFRNQHQASSVREMEGMSPALSHNNAALYHQNSESTTVSNDGDSLPLPPPPTLYDDSLLRQYSTILSQGGGSHVDTFGTRTSKSTTSAASVTLTSNPSVMSSQTDESEDESRRRVCTSSSLVGKEGTWGVYISLARRGDERHLERGVYVL